MITREEFGLRLKALRTKRGYNMSQVAAKIGVARSTYAGYETQNVFPPLESLVRIAEALYTSTDYLIGLTEDTEPKDTPHNIVEYLSNASALHWNGIPLSDDDLKPLKDLFEIIVRERLPKVQEENNEEAK